MATQQQIVAVLVPGITGSRLLGKTGEIVWPDLVMADRRRARQQLSRTDLTPGAPIEQILNPTKGKFVDVYGGLIRYFTSQLGTQERFRYVKRGATLPATTDNVLLGFGYDWRVSNEVTAAQLSTTLGEAATKYPKAKIWLVAHSMGGLVSRYMLETVPPAKRSWKVEGLVTLGTPHLGAPLALSAITGECDQSHLLNPDIIEEVIDIPTNPSGFQLLPPPSVPFVRDLSGSAWDIYEAESPVHQLLVADGGFHAPRESFRSALDFFSGLGGSTAPAGVPPYFLVYGTGLDTAAAFRWTPGPGVKPAEQLFEDTTPGKGAGDGIVPARSAAFEGGWSMTRVEVPGVGHGELPGDRAVLNRIAGWMGLQPAPKEVSSAEPEALAAV